MPRSAALDTDPGTRDFARASEHAALSFVIEMRDARRLHFDFLLELDGTLKCWAVTRGPSLDPAEKRLAVRTEDHRLALGSTLPKGQNGGSTITVWDEGCWLPRGDPRTGLEQGLLKFELEGKRVRGGFSLVRLPNKPKEKRENWLLVKEPDGYAVGSGNPVGQWTTSVATGCGLMQIGGGAARASTTQMQREDARSRMPKFVAPQLAMLASAPPTGEDWVHEIKYDGYRAIAAITGDRVRIYTRSGQDWTDKFAPIARALSHLDVASALLDGEIVALDDRGVSSFQRLQNALNNEKRSPLVYFVFDLLELDGRDLRKEPLIRRKERLRALLKTAPASIRYSDHVVGGGEKVLAEACRRGLEGIVSKRATGAYLSKRTGGWLKSKCTGNEEFVIGGYRLSTKKGRPFASLLLGEYKGRELLYRGRVGTGFDADNMRDLGEKLERLARKTSPFSDADREVGRDARWVEPRLVAQVAFTERTTDGRLRHPSFLGLRGDKPAREVQETPTATTTRRSPGRSQG